MITTRTVFTKSFNVNIIFKIFQFLNCSIELQSTKKNIIIITNLLFIILKVSYDYIHYFILIIIGTIIVLTFIKINVSDNISKFLILSLYLFIIFLYRYNIIDGNHGIASKYSCLLQDIAPITITTARTLILYNTRCSRRS